MIADFSFFEQSTITRQTYSHHVHRWSCCGETSPDAPGCKQAAHEPIALKEITSTTDEQLERLFSKTTKSIVEQSEKDDDVVVIEPQQMLQPVHVPGHNLQGYVSILIK